MLLLSNLKAFPSAETWLFTMIHMLKWERVSEWLFNSIILGSWMFLCGKPLISSACSKAFILLRLTSTQKALYSWPIPTSDEPFQKAVDHTRMCVRMCTFKDVIIRTEGTLSWWCCSHSFTGRWPPEHKKFSCLRPNTANFAFYVSKILTTPLSLPGWKEFMNFRSLNENGRMLWVDFMFECLKCTVYNWKVFTQGFLFTLRVTDCLRWMLRYSESLDKDRVPETSWCFDGEHQCHIPAFGEESVPDVLINWL